MTAIDIQKNMTTAKSSFVQEKLFKAFQLILQLLSKNDANKSCSVLQYPPEEGMIFHGTNNDSGVTANIDFPKK